MNKFKAAMCARLNAEQSGLTAYSKPCRVMPGALIEITSVVSLPSLDKSDDGVRYNGLVLGVRGEHTGACITISDVPPEALDHAPGLMYWDESLSASAARQGWGLYETEGDTAIQKDDDANRFSSDEDACRYVWEGAEHGDPVSKRALEYLFQRYPENYEVVHDLIQKDRSQKPGVSKKAASPSREVTRFEWPYIWDSGDEEVIAVYVDRSSEEDSSDWKVIAVGRIRRNNDLILPDVALDSVEDALYELNNEDGCCPFSEFRKRHITGATHDVFIQAFAVDNEKMDVITALSHNLSPVRSSLIVSGVAGYLKNYDEVAVASDPIAPSPAHLTPGTCVVRIDKA